MLPRILEIHSAFYISISDRRKNYFDVQGRAHAKYIAIKINYGKSIFIQFSYFKRYVVDVSIKYFFFTL
jgi:hypothetical protein